MKYSTLVLIFTFLILFSSCKKEKSEVSDWKPTQYRFLILDSTTVDLNTRARFVRVNDSELFFYGYNGSQRNCFYKLNLNNDKLIIQDLKQSIFGKPSDIMDISFPDRSTGFLLMKSIKDQNDYTSEILKSNDGGLSWKLLNFQNTFSYIHFITADSGIAISSNSFGFNSAIYTSTDGGINWQKSLGYFDDNHTIYRFYFIPNKPRICFAVSSGYLYYSLNGGFSWQLHNNIKADITAISFLNENEGFIFNYSHIVGSPCNMNTVYRIDSIGGSYERMYKADDMILKIEALNENEVYFNQMFPPYIFYTTDGFQTVEISTIQDPNPNLEGDRCVADFTLFSFSGILSDTKGTLYLKR